MSLGGSLSGNGGGGGSPAVIPAFTYAAVTADKSSAAAHDTPPNTSVLVVASITPLASSQVLARFLSYVRGDSGSAGGNAYFALYVGTNAVGAGGTLRRQCRSYLDPLSFSGPGADFEWTETAMAPGVQIYFAVKWSSDAGSVTCNAVSAASTQQASLTLQEIGR